VRTFGAQRDHDSDRRPKSHDPSRETDHDQSDMTSAWERKFSLVCLHAPAPLPRSKDLDELSDEGIQEIVMTLNSPPRKCLAFKTPIEALLSTLGKDVQIRSA
jgi:hypothetical protein